MDKKDKMLSEGFSSFMKNKGLGDLLSRQAEFAYIPVDSVIVRKQVRAEIDKESDSFKALKESIAEKGVIEPIVVREEGKDIILIAGERRLRACQELGITSIPARFLYQQFDAKETLAIQLIENLQREDLSPLDEAQGYFELFEVCAGVQDVRECLNNLLLHERDSERVKNDFVDTVSTIQKISGKSMRSVRRLLSLLLLPEAVKNAFKEGKLNLTQCYLFASNLDHPRFDKILEKAIEGKLTKDALAEEFKKTGIKKSKSKLSPVSKLTNATRKFRTNFAKLSLSQDELEELDNLKKEIETLLKLFKRFKS